MKDEKYKQTLDRVEFCDSRNGSMGYAESSQATVGRRSTRALPDAQSANGGQQRIEDRGTFSQISNCSHTIDLAESRGAEVPSRIGTAAGFISKSSLNIANPSADNSHVKESFELSAVPGRSIFFKGHGMVSHDSLPISGDASVSYCGVNLITGTAGMQSNSGISMGENRDQRSSGRSGTSTAQRAKTGQSEWYAEELQKLKDELEKEQNSAKPKPHSGGRRFKSLTRASNTGGGVSGCKKQKAKA